MIQSDGGEDIITEIGKGGEEAGIHLPVPNVLYIVHINTGKLNVSGQVNLVCIGQVEGPLEAEAVGKIVPK